MLQIVPVGASERDRRLGGGEGVLADIGGAGDGNAPAPGDDVLQFAECVFEGAIAVDHDTDRGRLVGLNPVQPVGRHGRDPSHVDGNGDDEQLVLVTDQRLFPRFRQGDVDEFHDSRVDAPRDALNDRLRCSGRREIDQFNGLDFHTLQSFNDVRGLWASAITSPN